jgi:glucose 1-dehydrogenase
MKAITVQPHTPETARLEDIPDPDPRDGSVLVEAIAVGVCGTDVEIVEGKYGWAPPGKSRLVLGHESLGRVVDPGPSGGLREGDLVVGIVRRPDPVPCPNCAVGEWDMCRNGQYTERGIKEIDGFMSERWRIEPEYAMKVDPSLGLLGVLLEPTTVVTKAWEQVLAIGQRAFLGAAHGARHRRGTDRPAGGAGRQAARARGPRPRSRGIGTEARTGARPGRDLSHRQRFGRGVPA